MKIEIIGYSIFINKETNIKTLRIIGGKKEDISDEKYFGIKIIKPFFLDYNEKREEILKECIIMKKECNLIYESDIYNNKIKIIDIKKIDNENEFML